MYISREKVEAFIDSMVKIYGDIHKLSSEGGPGIGNADQYLGKVRALIEFKYYMDKGHFDDDLIRSIQNSLNIGDDVKFYE